MWATINVNKKMQTHSDCVCWTESSWEHSHFPTALNSGIRIGSLKKASFTQSQSYKAFSGLCLWIMLSVSVANSAVPTCVISGPQSQELCAETKSCSLGRLIFLEFCREHESQITKFLDTWPIWDTVGSMI